MILTFKIPRTKITKKGIWTGDLFFINNDIKKSKGLFIEFKNIKKIIIKNKNILSYKNLEKEMIKKLNPTTIHLPIDITTNSKTISFLIYNYEGFIKSLDKLKIKVKIE